MRAYSGIKIFHATIPLNWQEETKRNQLTSYYIREGLKKGGNCDHFPTWPPPPPLSEVKNFRSFFLVSFTFGKQWKIYCSNSYHVFGLIVIIKAQEYFKGACHHFLVSATKVLEIEELVFNMEIIAISSMCEVEREHNVCFWAFLKLTKVFFLAGNKSPKECDLRPLWSSNLSILTSFGEGISSFIKLLFLPPWKLWARTHSHSNLKTQPSWKLVEWKWVSLIKHRS